MRVCRFGTESSGPVARWGRVAARSPAGGEPAAAVTPCRFAPCRPAPFPFQPLAPPTHPPSHGRALPCGWCSLLASPAVAPGVRLTCRSASVSCVSGQLRSSAICTARPLMWCVSLRGEARGEGLDGGGVGEAAGGQAGRERRERGCARGRGRAGRGRMRRGGRAYSPMRCVRSVPCRHLTQIRTCPPVPTPTATEERKTRVGRGGARACLLASGAIHIHRAARAVRCRARSERGVPKRGNHYLKRKAALTGMGHPFGRGTPRDLWRA
jgi:hypothetical protein